MRFIVRNFKRFKTNKLRHVQPRAQISIASQGNPIRQQELFAYTNGRFLVGEQHQFDRRFVQFDLDALCDVASTAGGDSSPITTVEKMEGGFSKALRMKKGNDKQVIAKIPCRIAGPAFLTTASEVAVLQYVKKHTKISVPQVFDYSADRSNAVGAEYIIMEKASGIPLFQRWDSMTEFEKLELVKNLTKIESELSSISFPAYGALYLQSDAHQMNNYKALGDDIDSTGSFCIGPSCDRSFGTDEAVSSLDSDGEVDRGPWCTLSSFGVAIARREISKITYKGVNKTLPFYQGKSKEQIQLLETTIDLMKYLDSNTTLSQSAQPTLLHTDLHMGNIYVAPDDSTRIVSLIDFQSISILPAFLLADWPVFLKPPQNYTKGFIQPKLPDGFDEFDEESKALALHEFSQFRVAKAYEVSTYLENKIGHNAMNAPRVFRELFIRCGGVSEMGIVPLRECLIEILRNWTDLGFQGECPYQFEEKDTKRHENRFAEYQEWYRVQELAQNCLDTDAEGWISPQLDFEEKREQNRELLSMYIEQVADEKSPEEAKKSWPFVEDV